MRRFLNKFYKTGPWCFCEGVKSSFFLLPLSFAGLYAAVCDGLKWTVTFKERLKRTNFKAFSNILLFTYSTDVCVQMLVRLKVLILWDFVVDCDEKKVETAEIQAFLRFDIRWIRFNGGWKQLYCIRSYHCTHYSVMISFPV